MKQTTVCRMRTNREKLVSGRVCTAIRQAFTFLEQTTRSAFSTLYCYETEAVVANAGSVISYSLNPAKILEPYGKVKILSMLPAVEFNQRL